MKPWELVVGRLVSILLNESRKCTLENVLSRPVMRMTTDSLAVSKPVSWACLEKFQNLHRAFRVNDLSSCRGSFNSVYVAVARVRKEANLKKLLKILVWKEFCAFVTVAPQSRSNRVSGSFCRNVERDDMLIT